MSNQSVTFIWWSPQGGKTSGGEHPGDSSRQGAVGPAAWRAGRSLPLPGRYCRTSGGERLPGYQIREGHRSLQHPEGFVCWCLAEDRHTRTGECWIQGHVDCDKQVCYGWVCFYVCFVYVFKSDCHVCLCVCYMCALVRACRHVFGWIHVVWVCVDSIHLWCIVISFYCLFVPVRVWVCLVWTAYDYVHACLREVAWIWMHGWCTVIGWVGWGEYFYLWAIWGRAVQQSKIFVPESETGSTN